MPKPERDAKRPQDWTLEEKLDAVVQSMRLSDEELGAFLRNRGLHKADLDEWRASVFKGARAELAGNGQAKSRELKPAQAIELLGATAVLTGIRPGIAQTLVELGINLDTLIIRSTLREGISFAFERAARSSRHGSERRPPSSA
jgi:hypothetical protein